MKPPACWSLGPADIASLTFQELRSGVEISVLFENEEAGRIAVLRYAPGAEVPAHRHDGYELIYVLQGSQSDERGTYSAGSFVVNEPGMSHRVVSQGGCVVLIHWQRPVVFL